MSKWKTSPCRGCGEPMVWTLTRHGKKMPVDTEEVTRATAGPKALLFELSESENGKEPLATKTDGPEGYISHWATCPKREDFKR